MTCAHIFFVLQLYSDEMTLNGQRVGGGAGEGTVIGARCSPANQLTQYWVRRPNGERFWAPSQELKPIGPEPSTAAPNNGMQRTRN